MTIACTNCRRPYPVQGAPHRCPQCGGLLDVAPWEFDLAQVDTSQPGLWRYRHTFTAIDPHQAPVTLGEGLTPLLWAEVFGRQVAFKAEHLNPTGSFKDRGSALIATFLQGRGILQAVEDSSGNAGASFAAYAARAGMQAHIYVPEAASGPKRGQIENYGAHIHPIPGTRADVTSALERDLRPPGNNPVAYASHAALPVNLPGYATAAYEIYEQLGSAPGAVLCPVGQGGLFLGMYRGFDALRRAGLIERIPRMVGVQAVACAPLWTMTSLGYQAMGFVVERPTLAEGVRVRSPLRAQALLQMAEQGTAEFVAVEETEILPARDELLQRGLYVEPTSAIAFAALKQVIARLPDPVVVALTGSGGKFEG